MAAGGAEARASLPSSAVPFLAALGLLAIGACVVVAVVSLTERRTQLLERDVQIAAERHASEIAAAVGEI